MRVLYVCTGNSFRSPVAEALTRKHHPSFEVESAGTEPAEGVAENAKELLDEKGALGYVKPAPDPVSERAIMEADVIVCMEEHHSSFVKEKFRAEEKDIRIWDVKDPIIPEVKPEEAVRDIEEKVIRMVP